MTWLEEFKRLSAVFLAVLFTVQGASCELVVSPEGPSRVNAAAGSTVTLAVSFSGASDPAVTWFIGGLPVVLWTVNSGAPPTVDEKHKTVLQIEKNGSLTFVNVPLDYTNSYMVEMTKPGLEQASTTFTLIVFERPLGNPECSVESANDVDLRYRCEWTGGTPPAQLSFPALSSGISGAGEFNLTVTASDNLNGKTVECTADHQAEEKKCNVTASRPVEFLPAVRTTVNPEGKIVVAIHCVCEAVPKGVVSWSKGSEAVASGATHQISSNATLLEIRDHDVSNFLLQNYACTCRNPLGSQTRKIQLQGPTISDSSLFPNENGTVITLTWEVPPTSVVTGFDIQMKGPDLLSKNSNATPTKGSPNRYRTIQQKPGSARSADVFVLDPNLTYRFRVIPKARLTEGEPSGVHRIGPAGEGLSGPAIAGIAAGIPCSLLFLLLLGGLIYLCVYCNMNKSHQTRYPVPRAVEKAKTIQPDSTPHNPQTGGLKSPPDYNTFHQDPSERSVALPTFVPPPPVRVATTV
ncbi:V-set and immunoglobulin domain-containing protein 10-like isoform X1 [Brachyistius frenatus]|uniref:V-set and immunoglobulin domain-containing protein 10-like isoform X1 n=1 Tax=Brachyistius frenatus TaxID=100188 RepID=UPI0037E962D0